MIRRTVHVDVFVERLRRDRPEHHVVRRVAGSGRARRRLPVSVSVSPGGRVAGASAAARVAKYDVDNFQRGYETGAEKQRQQAAHVSWLNHRHKRRQTRQSTHDYLNYRLLHRVSTQQAEDQA